ncbi:Plant organelle RNA recognition domain [Macleaya cordata]|uniref:Plant organelle RNA recognition domain n=1 Tax=Macleaya cordata TaxID=56857 RepID=A0A200R8R7_MACCD|nr:Plant organelle RNA recognition domain [Macleaya cordata]
MIHRYPTIFQIFTIPSSSTHQDHLCVRLTPKAQALASQESALKSTISTTLAIKLQKLLMLSSHHRLLLSKLVHLGPDLGLPPNFRSRLCNNHPDRFKTVDTSYGRALELVSWDPKLAIPLPPLIPKTPNLIVDRPLKFKHLSLRKGLNLKRKHRDFLIKFGEMPEISPYNEVVGELGLGFRPGSIEAEKRSCGLVREILGMTVEKRTLVDHLTHFRKEFGLSNKVRGMLVRHPEMFYVSVKGQRDSVFLVEGYDEEGGLLEKDELLGIKEKLMELGWVLVLMGSFGLLNLLLLIMVGVELKLGDHSILSLDVSTSY